MPGSFYEDEMRYLMHWIAAYGENCINVCFSSKAKFRVSVFVSASEDPAAPWHWWDPIALRCQALAPAPGWCPSAGVPTRHCCASCDVIFLDCCCLANTAGSPKNALCQVSALLQQLWCPHPSLLPPWVHTAWVPWTWEPYLEASTPPAHVEPWWGGDSKRKTSKAHVSEMSASVIWPGKHTRVLGVFKILKPTGIVVPDWSGRCQAAPCQRPLMECLLIIACWLHWVKIETELLHTQEFPLAFKSDFWETARAIIYEFSPQMPSMTGAENSVWVFHMGGRCPIRWAVTAPSQGLHQQEAGVSRQNLQ